MNFDEKDYHKKSLKRAFNVKDGYLTPSCLVEILLDFLPPKEEHITIWCPFDKEESNYVKILRNAGYEVICSHIEDGKDFFKYEPEKWDIAISNPPFSTKLKIFERLIEFDKPFAMLMNMMCINYNEIGNLFYKAGPDIQFLIPDKKISFDGKTSSFCSGYVCYKFLERTEFVHLPNNNSGKDYKF